MHDPGPVKKPSHTPHEESEKESEKESETRRVREGDKAPETWERGTGTRAGKKGKGRTEVQGQVAHKCTQLTYLTKKGEGRSEEPKALRGRGATQEDAGGLCPLQTSSAVRRDARAGVHTYKRNASESETERRANERMQKGNEMQRFEQNQEMREWKSAKRFPIKRIEVSEVRVLVVHV